MRKLLEAMDQFAGQPEQVPGEQWRGTDAGTPGNKLVGEAADERTLVKSWPEWNKAVKAAGGQVINKNTHYVGRINFDDAENIGEWDRDRSTGWIRKSDNLGESDKNKQQYTHDASCPYVTYGGDCTCGEKTKTHSNDCAYRQGHDCDCAMSRNDNRRFDMDEAAVEEGRGKHSPDCLYFKGAPCDCYLSHRQGVGEAVGEATPITSQDIIAAWLQVFPNSDAQTRKAFGNDHIVRLYLTKDISECNNKIRDNDPLRYTVTLNKDGSMSEPDLSMLVKPTNPHMAYSSVKIPKRTMKAPTVDKLVKRFQQVHDFVAANAANMHNIKFDINEKLGTGAVSETPGDFVGKPFIREESSDQKAHLDVEHLDRRDLAHLQDELEKSGLVIGKDFWIKSDGTSWITYSAYDRQPLDILQKYRVGEYEDVDESLSEGRGNPIRHGDIVTFKRTNSHYEPMTYYRADTEEAIGATSERPWVGDLERNSGWYVPNNELDIVVSADEAETHNFTSSEDVENWLEGYDMDESVTEAPELTNLDRNKALAHAPKDDGERQGIWMNHYRRAKQQMGKPDREARFYADQMTRSEPSLQQKAKPSVFDSIDFNESEEQVAEALKVAFEDYVSNEKYDADKLYPGKSKKASADKKKAKAPKVVDPNTVNEADVEWKSLDKKQNKYKDNPNYNSRYRNGDSEFGDDIVKAADREGEDFNKRMKPVYKNILNRPIGETAVNEETNSAEMKRLKSELANAKRNKDEEDIDYLSREIRKLKGEMELRARDKVTESESFQWTDYNHIPSMEDRLFIAETYFTKTTNLTESNDGPQREYFDALTEMSEDPAAGNKYICTVLGLVNNKLLNLQHTEVITFIERDSEGYKVKNKQGNISTYPPLHEGNAMVISTFFFSSKAAYDKFKTAVSLKFNHIFEGKSENRELWDRINSRGTVPSIDRERYTDLSHEGLEGPYRMKTGKVLYYDAKAGKYYDRDSDMYVSNEDMDEINRYGLGEAAGPSKNAQYGVRYKVFGRGGRIETRERWFKSEEALTQGTENIEQTGNFYEFDSFSYPEEKQVDESGFDDTLAPKGHYSPPGTNKWMPVTPEWQKKHPKYNKKRTSDIKSAIKTRIDRGDYEKAPLPEASKIPAGDKFNKALEKTQGGKREKIQALMNKMSDVQSKLAGIKDQTATKKPVEEDNIAPVGPAVDPKVQQAQVNAANAIAASAKSQKPIPGAPQNASQQAPAPAGTATVATTPGQQVPPTAGQPGGAPVAPKPGTPTAATGTAANSTTTPMQSLANSLTQLSQPGAGNKLGQAAKAIANIK